MIRNVVFDMGEVLIHFEPEKFLTKEGITDPKERSLVMETLFASDDWPRLDEGTLTERELEEKAKRILPIHLHEAVHNLLFSWDEPLDPVMGMEEIVRDLKAAGLGVYLLSNASFRQKEYWSRIPGSCCFDGRIVSAEHRCMKPDPKIFEILFRTYGLDAAECVFVDDLERNVAAARKLGMQGVVFDGSADHLRESLRDMGLQV